MKRPGEVDLPLFGEAEGRRTEAEGWREGEIRSVGMSITIYIGIEPAHDRQRASSAPMRRITPAQSPIAC